MRKNILLILLMFCFSLEAISFDDAYEKLEKLMADAYDPLVKQELKLDFYDDANVQSHALAYFTAFYALQRTILRFEGISAAYDVLRALQTEYEFLFAANPDVHRALLLYLHSLYPKVIGSFSEDALGQIEALCAALKRKSEECPFLGFVEEVNLDDIASADACGGGVGSAVTSSASASEVEGGSDSDVSTTSCPVPAVPVKEKAGRRLFGIAFRLPPLVYESTLEEQGA